MTQAHAHAPSPPRTPGTGRRLLAPLGVLAGTAAAVTFVSQVDPHEPGHYPTCPFLFMTGLYCPGCGGLRMVHDLTHGDVGGAFGLNPLAFLMLPVLGYLWARWVTLSARGETMRSALLGSRVAYVFLGVVLAYWLVRNLPFGHALAP